MQKRTSLQVRLVLFFNLKAFSYLGKSSFILGFFLRGLFKKEMFPAKFSNLAPNLNKEESSNLSEFDTLGADAISGCLKHFRLFSLY